MWKRYFTDSPYAFDKSKFWYIDYSSVNHEGLLHSRSRVSNDSVRCVSGNLDTNKKSELIDNKDGTITDKGNNLIWQKCSIGQTDIFNCTDDAVTLEFNGADKRCESLSLGGKKWRLPSVEELRSLVDYEKKLPWAIDYKFFPSKTSGPNLYWASTPKVRRDGQAVYCVDLFDGMVGQNNPLNRAAVRCVSDI
jgi:hypothetical protein